MAQPLEMYKLQKTNVFCLFFWILNFSLALRCVSFPWRSVLSQFQTGTNSTLASGQRKWDFPQALIGKKMNICLSNVYPCWLFSHTTPTTQTAASVCQSKCNLITHPASKPPLFLRLCSLPSCGVAAAPRGAHKGTAALPSASPPFPLWLPHNFF